MKLQLHIYLYVVKIIYTNIYIIYVIVVILIWKNNVSYVTLKIFLRYFLVHFLKSYYLMKNINDDRSKIHKADNNDQFNYRNTKLRKS